MNLHPTQPHSHTATHTYKLSCPLAGAVPPSTALPHTISVALMNWLLLLLLLATELASLLPPSTVVTKETWHEVVKKVATKVVKKAVKKVGDLIPGT